MTASAVVVRRARLGPRWATAPGRAWLRRGLADVDVSRHGLPSQAIVIVRRLQASAPAWPDGHADLVTGPLRAALGAAVRPAQQALVGAGVTTVWFADEAELLACMARDVLAEALSVRWWWPLLFGQAATPALVLQRWLGAPQAVPWALQAMSEGRPAAQGRQWLVQLGPAGRAALLQALARAYPVCAAVQAGVQAWDAAPQHARSGGRCAPWPGPPSVGQPGCAAAPHAAGLDGAALLLRLAEVLRVAPQRAGSPALLAELRAAPLAPWLVAGAAGATGAGGAAPAAGVARRAGGAVGALGTDGPGAARPAAALPWRVRPVVERVKAVSAQDGGGPGGPGPAQGAAATPTPLHHRAWPPSAEARPAAPALRLRGPLPPSAAAGLAPAAAAAAVPGLPSRAPSLLLADHLHTQFGGVAFLLNVALSLGLYGDFTQPQRPGLELSPWRLLHTALVAGCARAGRADALTHWLLARAAPETRLAAPWQLPGTALQAFDADTRAWHALLGGGVWQLWHPAGFCVAHQVPHAEAPALLAGLQAPPQHLVRHPWRRGGAAPRLSRLVWPLLRARLALALGLPARAAVALCLPLPARVQARGERLDLHFRLDALPLALRLAGLDRDPGWLPAAGSDIRFHFD